MSAIAATVLRAIAFPVIPPSWFRQAPPPHRDAAASSTPTTSFASNAREFAIDTLTWNGEAGNFLLSGTDHFQFGPEGWSRIADGTRASWNEFVKHGSRWALLACASACLGLFVWLAMTISSGAVGNFDEAIRSGIHRFSSPDLTRLARGVSLLGSGAVIASLSIIAVIGFYASGATTGGDRAGGGHGGRRRPGERP